MGGGRRGRGREGEGREKREKKDMQATKLEGMKATMKATKSVWLTRFSLCVVIYSQGPQ